jgi:hypothetical protein
MTNHIYYIPPHVPVLRPVSQQPHYRPTHSSASSPAPSPSSLLVQVYTNPPRVQNSVYFDSERDIIYADVNALVAFSIKHDNVPKYSHSSLSRFDAWGFEA